MATPEQAHPLFLDHVALALSVHIASVYGGMESKHYRGGLAPAQQRRVEELIAANLREDVSLSRLADECGLSVRHFSRAFKQSTGMTPHQRLLHHRVARAKSLLSSEKLSMTEVALSCGFADQSHLTRVFKKIVGCTPGEWRGSR
jgi:transcriptional regulator GlxA family with amidase domain